MKPWREMNLAMQDTLVRFPCSVGPPHGGRDVPEGAFEVEARKPLPTKRCHGKGSLPCGDLP